MSKQTVSQSQIKITNLGLCSYGEALRLQEEVHAGVIGGAAPEILVVQHPPTLTFGKNSDETNLLFPRSHYTAGGIEIFDIDRGGEVTAHVPGQLVVYPILPLTKLNLTVKSYVNGLEDAVIKTLEAFGIRSARDPEYPGVWIGERKICALGVRVKSRVSMHGLALNVNNELDLFQKIVPCGIRSRGVTTMEQELGRPVDLTAVGSHLIECLRNTFLI